MDHRRFFSRAGITGIPQLIELAYDAAYLWRLHPLQVLDMPLDVLLELLERRHDTGSTVFCTQYAKKDWHPRLGSGVRADEIMDRIVHNAIWIDTGTKNMREHAAMTQ